MTRQLSALPGFDRNPPSEPLFPLLAFERTISEAHKNIIKSGAKSAPRISDFHHAFHPYAPFSSPGMRWVAKASGPGIITAATSAHPIAAQLPLRSAMSLRANFVSQNPVMPTIRRKVPETPADCCVCCRPAAGVAPAPGAFIVVANEADL